MFPIYLQNPSRGEEQKEKRAAGLEKHAPHPSGPLRGKKEGL
jgi:hypothetical protein